MSVLNIATEASSGTLASPWAVNEDGCVTRFVATPAQRQTAALLDIVGEQDQSGELLSQVLIVEIPGGRVEIDAATARSLGEDLLAAADRLERVTR
jgi:hypothetical protein